MVRFEVSSTSGVSYAHHCETYSPFASIIYCPLGWSVRWHCMEIGTPGSCEIRETLEEAQALCVEWAYGLVIQAMGGGLTVIAGHVADACGLRYF